MTEQNEILEQETTETKTAATTQQASDAPASSEKQESSGDQEAQKKKKKKKKDRKEKKKADKQAEKEAAEEAAVPDEDIFFEMTNINKYYQMGEEQAHILKDVCLKLERGEYLSVLGPSGSGKSTLMNIIGCLDVASSGSYILHGQMIEDMTEADLAGLRSEEIGFIFQNHQLLPRLTAQKNVELPLIYAGVPPRERRRRAKEMLDRVGLADRRNHFPNQLSGGQCQRVAIARALVGNPSILLADEPTGALDQKTGRQVMELFEELYREGRTIIMITHDMNIAKYAHRVVHIIDGELTEGGGTQDA